MLVRIEPGHEPPGLDLHELPVLVYRVRHPLPACVRMRVLRPEVLLVGPSVPPRDLALMIDEANDLEAAIVWLPLVFPTESLRERVLDLIDVVRARRAERVKKALAS